METPLLTEWEARERAGLLALETPEGREKRLIAENLSTSAEELECLANEVGALWKAYKDREQCRLILQAIVAHHNTPAVTLLSLLARFSPFGFFDFVPRNEMALFCGRPLGHNPQSALLHSQIPDFWKRLALSACHDLLRGELLPDAVAQQISLRSEPQDDETVWYLDTLIALEVQLHVTQSGELKTPDEGRYALTQFWRTYCADLPPTRPGDGKEIDEHVKLVELGLAPPWAVGQPAIIEQLIPSYILDLYKSKWAKAGLGETINHTTKQYNLQNFATGCRQSRLWLETIACRRLTYLFCSCVFVPRLLFKLVFQFNSLDDDFFSGANMPHISLSLTRKDFLAFKGEEAMYSMPFSNFVVNLHDAFPFGKTFRLGQSLDWQHRLNAALKLPFYDEPFSEDLWNRSPLQLMKHLAHDGNRFVRWAAQTRLADPDFVFTWQSDE